ncbi:MAG: hypothetical protein AAFQ17_05860, partial [Pseudomonadota bacterium]
MPQRPTRNVLALAAAVAAILALTAALPACTKVYSTTPLIEAGQAEPDDRVTGVWGSGDDVEELLMEGLVLIRPKSSRGTYEFWIVSSSPDFFDHDDDPASRSTHTALQSTGLLQRAVVVPHDTDGREFHATASRLMDFAIRPYPGDERFRIAQFTKPADRHGRNPTSLANYAEATSLIEPLPVFLFGIIDTSRDDHLRFHLINAELSQAFDAAGLAPIRTTDVGRRNDRTSWYAPTPTQLRNAIREVSTNALRELEESDHVPRWNGDITLEMFQVHRAHGSRPATDSQQTKDESVKSSD